jgi:hypothetical protein
MGLEPTTFCMASARNRSRPFAPPQLRVPKPAVLARGAKPLVGEADTSSASTSQVERPLAFAALELSRSKEIDLGLVVCHPPHEFRA